MASVLFLRPFQVLFLFLIQFLLFLYIILLYFHTLALALRFNGVADPGSSAFLTHGSGIPHQKPIFLWVKSTLILCKWAQIFIL
jgi:hypothetical protein